MAYINKKKIYFAGISKGISERYTEGIIVEDIETEEPEDELVGTWVFNEVPVISNDFDVEFNYISNGISYTRMKVLTLATDGYGERILYQKNDSIGAYINSQYQVNWWRDGYRTINITSAPTDESFIAWLRANATKQGATNLISFTIDGVSYQAEQSMTWVEWAASDYNIGSAFNFSGAWQNGLTKASNSYSVYNTITGAYAGHTGVSGLWPIETDVIANGIYATKFVSHGGGSD